MDQVEGISNVWKRGGISLPFLKHAFGYYHSCRGRLYCSCAVTIALCMLAFLCGFVCVDWQWRLSEQSVCLGSAFEQKDHKACVQCTTAERHWVREIKKRKEEKGRESKIVTFWFVLHAYCLQTADVLLLWHKKPKEKKKKKHLLDSQEFLPFPW